MNLKNTLEICAEAANDRRKMAYFNQRGKNPNNEPRNPLMGYCFKNTREVSWELAQRHIPHRIVRGAITYDSVVNYPHWLIPEGERKLPEEIEKTINEFLAEECNDSGAINTDLWEEIPKPQSVKELPDEASHYWVEVDGRETQFDDNQVYVVEAAAEARKHYGEPTVHEGHPTQYYLKADDSYVEPWTRRDEWEWNPRATTNDKEPSNQRKS